MNVRLGILWRFALNDELDAVDVQTSRRDVGGDQDLKLIIAESSQNNLALTLIHVAVKRLGPFGISFCKLSQSSPQSRLVSRNTMTPSASRRLGTNDVAHEVDAIGPLTRQQHVLHRSARFLLLIAH